MKKFLLNFGLLLFSISAAQAHSGQNEVSIRQEIDTNLANLRTKLLAAAVPQTNIDSAFRGSKLEEAIRILVDHAQDADRALDLVSQAGVLSWGPSSTAAGDLMHTAHEAMGLAYKLFQMESETFASQTLGERIDDDTIIYGDLAKQRLVRLKTALVLRRERFLRYRLIVEDNTNLNLDLRTGVQL